MIIFKQKILPQNLANFSKFFYSTTKNKDLSNDFTKILILHKISRYEYEKKRNATLSELELKEKLKKRGSNYERLVEHHNTHYRSLDKILKVLNDHKIETRVTQRNDYKYNDIEWANCVLTAGGDGTFLLGAAKIRDNKKPIFGINTDITSSEGHLLMPKQQSINFGQTFKRILNGDFNWVLRTRIKIILEGQNLNKQPIELHDQTLNRLEHRYVEHFEENRTVRLSSDKVDTSNNKSNSTLITEELPNLVLNEVFIGESLSARVSYYQMSIDNGPFFKQKSSGIIVCTGTGSTSWCYNINKLSSQSMKKIVKIINNELDGKLEIPIDEDKFIEKITNRFNDSIVFEPDELRMAYTIRDPIINRIFDNETNRGFAKKIVVQSRCFDACLVIDGGISYQFNDGAIANLEISPENSLKTIFINDEP